MKRLAFIAAVAAALTFVPLGLSQEVTPSPPPPPAQGEAPETQTQPQAQEQPATPSPEPAPAATPAPRPLQNGAPRGEPRNAVTSSSGWQRYGVIVDRNIFSRQRTSASRGGNNAQGGNNTPGEATAPKPPAPPPEPGTQVVLIGVSFVGDYATAVFEDRRDGRIYAAQVGEKLIDRTVENISLDGVAVDHQGEKVQVVIGRTLAGTDAPTSTGAASSSSSSSSSASSSASTEPISDAQKAILERLRARREEQMKK